jgi:prevent-host-death family protein
MKITTKELRIQPGKIIDQVANGHEITVTFRGKALAKMIPIKNKVKTTGKESLSIFGLWKDHTDTENVEDYVRNLRRGRQF